MPPPTRAPAVVETARLRLVRPRATDAAAIFTRFASDPEVTRYMAWPTHRSLDDTLVFLASSDEQWRRWPAGPYLIWSREDDRLLGSTGLDFESTNRAQTGYVLARDAWGFGYATEALRAVIEVARTIGVTRLGAECHPSHEASWRVLGKCGFVRDSGQRRRAVFPNLAPGVEQNAAWFELTIGER